MREVLCDNPLHALLGVFQLIDRQCSNASVHDSMTGHYVGFSEGRTAIRCCFITDCRSPLNIARVKGETVFSPDFSVKRIENSGAFINGAGTHILAENG